MLSPEDIQIIREMFIDQIEVLKEIFYTKEEIDLKFAVIEEKFNAIQLTLDYLAKGKESLDQEAIILNYRIKNTENWIEKAALKLRLAFRH